MQGRIRALPENLLVPPRSTSNQAVQEAIGRMKEALDDAKLNLVKAQERTKTQVDKTRREEEWKVSDRVFPQHAALANLCSAFAAKAETTMGGSRSQSPRSLVQLPSGWICLPGGKFIQHFTPVT